MDDAPINSRSGGANRTSSGRAGGSGKGSRFSFTGGGGDAVAEKPRYHVDLGLVSLLVAFYDLGILSLTAWLALLSRPVLLVPSYLVTVLALVLGVLCGWAWLRSRNRPSIDHFIAETGWRRVSGSLLRDAVLFGIPLAAIALSVGVDDPLFAWVLGWAIMAAGGSLGLRIALAAMIARWRREGALRQNIAIVGSGDLAARLITWLRSTCADSVEVIGVFDDRRRRDPSHVHFVGLLTGTTDDLVELSRNALLDRIIVALPHAAEERLMHVLRKLRRIPVDICLAPDQVGFAAAVTRPGDYSGLPVVKIYGRPLEGGHRLAKAMFDRGLAGLALLFAGPAMLCLWALLRLGDARPALVRETRLGFGTRPIGLFSFRHDEQRFLGRALARSGLYLLPRLLNVVRGELSIVGPRAMPVDSLPLARADQELVEEYALRHRVKPGLTGWAQIHRSPTQMRLQDLRSDVQNDLHYIDHWSLWLDIKILMKTAARSVSS